MKIPTAWPERSKPARSTSNTTPAQTQTDAKSRSLVPRRSAASAVLGRGLEPPHPFGHQNLNLARLPIPPPEPVTTSARDLAHPPEGPQAANTRFPSAARRVGVPGPPPAENSKPQVPVPAARLPLPANPNCRPTQVAFRARKQRPIPALEHSPTAPRACRGGAGGRRRYRSPKSAEDPERRACPGRAPRRRAPPDHPPCDG